MPAVAPLAVTVPVFRAGVFDCGVNDTRIVQYGASVAAAGGALVVPTTHAATALWAAPAAQMASTDPVPCVKSAGVVAVVKSVAATVRLPTPVALTKTARITVVSEVAPALTEEGKAGLVALTGVRL